MDKEEFCRKFVARMVMMAPFDRFQNEDGTDAGSVAEYAVEAAPTYWDDPDQRAEGPEECADADISYWGE